MTSLPTAEQHVSSLSNEQTKNFIKDYYANKSYKEIKLKYGLTAKQADKLWNELIDKATYKNEEGGTTDG